MKPRLGFGNYWRVLHQFLLLDIRGRLPFRERTQRSWQLHGRREHGRKPESVRFLIEQESPGPDLELFGRADVSVSEWRVFAKQVDLRLFLDFDRRQSPFFDSDRTFSRSVMLLKDRNRIAISLKRGNVVVGETI